MKLLSLIFVAALGLSANAAAIHDCDGLDSIANLMAPVKSYANNAIRVAYITTEEPAAGPDHILVFVYDGEAAMNCHAISADENGFGFYGVNFPAIKAKYNASKGLQVTIPVSVYDGEQGVPATLKFRVNQATQAVTLE